MKFMLVCGALLVPVSAFSKGDEDACGGSATEACSGTVCAKDFSCAGAGSPATPYIDRIDGQLKWTCCTFTGSGS